MDLKLYDTLTREKRVFTPIDPARVRMYVCGPTVYDFAHIGNARPVIVFDVLFRLLKHLATQGAWDGGKGKTEVVYVRNITDVDDKINERAAKDFPSVALNEGIRELTKKTEWQFHEDVDSLGCLRPTEEPRATEHISEMITFIQKLIATKHAYERDGHVLFDVSSKRDYGKLSNRSTDEMIAGSRIEVAPYKRGPMDFVLWKPSAVGLPGWPSPWGRGRPGWHIECSAMSCAYLGKTFDIHGGGIDLIFPHHENEIAQSESAHANHPLANFWMHNNFLQLEGKKMSKSEGNVLRIRDLLERFPGDVLRLLMITGHYRQPLDWTQSGLEFAQEELLKWSELVADCFDPREDLSPLANPDPTLLEILSDDLNTPIALAHLRELFSAARRGKLPIEKFVGSALWLGFRHLNHPGFFRPGFEAKLYASGPQIDQEQADKIISVRATAANSLFTTSEALTRDLEAFGYVIKLDAMGSLHVANKTSADLKLSTKTIRPASLNSPHRLNEPKTIDHELVESLIMRRTAARNAKDFKESDRIRDELAAMGVVLKDSKDGTTWEVAR